MQVQRVIFFSVRLHIQIQIMRPMLKAIAAYALILSPVIASLTNDVAVAKRPNNNLTVDLDYAVYQGYKNVTTGLNIWKGYIRSSIQRHIC
jgi:hypothetical protein